MTSDHTPRAATRAAREPDDDFLRLRATGDPQVRDRLFRRHLPLARKMALRYARRGEPADDLLQVASIGLLHAIDRFCPERNVTFATYAVPCILGELRRHFRDHTWAVYVPRPLKDLRARLDRTRTELTAALGREPTIAELATALGESEETLLEVLAANSASLPASFDDDADEVHGAYLATYDDGFARAEQRALLDPLLATLTPLDRSVLELRFGSDLTQREIAGLLGISQMQVSRRLARTIRLLGEMAHDV